MLRHNLIRGRSADPCQTSRQTDWAASQRHQGRVMSLSGWLTARTHTQVHPFQTLIPGIHLHSDWIYFADVFLSKRHLKTAISSTAFRPTFLVDTVQQWHSQLQYCWNVVDKRVTTSHLNCNIVDYFEVAVCFQGSATTTSWIQHAGKVSTKGITKY